MRKATPSRAQGALPFYSFAEPGDFRLPLGCRLVGVEITDDAVELPRFRHPQRARPMSSGPNDFRCRPRC